ncbi:hypothetical protein CY0110_17332 [Crocosphaera chwakensis CCY0110]|uniref:Uncharacterized protein n=1 Tax=Crocosphaera chwakensis CCY0110 TaxID=391612 RepID=A3IIE8_9CHRO|nr:hypothetical protein CY0110_17332 [Crocosphaera chwakensis CCY0110]
MVTEIKLSLSIKLDHQTKLPVI